MNKIAIVALAGAATGVSAQSLDVVVTDTGSGTGTIVATSSLANALAFVWDIDGSFSTTDGIINLDLNAGFTNPILAPTPVTGNGTSSVSFTGVNATQLLPSPAFDNSNPFTIATFTYTGTFAGFDGGLNLSQISYAQPGAGFPDVQVYTDVNITYVPVPAPATAGLLGLGGLVAVRRRR